LLAERKYSAYACLMVKALSGKARSDCPIHVALELLGDSWSLLIVRDLMFKGRKTYKDFLEGEEGIASNILAKRLQHLESCGLLTRRPDPHDARRHLYRLTEVGIDLAPLIVELVLWSARHFKTGAPKPVMEQMANHRARFIRNVRAQWSEVAE
jgi:DNA-binding HxlR family transcriptional regulator